MRDMFKLHDLVRYFESGEYRFARVVEVTSTLVKLRHENGNEYWYSMKDVEEYEMVVPK